MNSILGPLRDAPNTKTPLIVASVPKIRAGSGN